MWGPQIESIDDNHETPLLLATENGHSTIVELLLKRKANIAHQNNIGSSALHFAAYDGHTSTAKLLLEHKADIKLEDEWSHGSRLRV